MEKAKNRELVMKANSVQPPTQLEVGEEPPVDGRSPKVRTASKEEFEKAQRKTSKLHAGLFRRLAK
jgi:hypothetical protein